MQSQNLNDWLQIVGAAGIIASLIFVGMQLRQTQKIAIAAQYQARHESSLENLRAHLHSGEVLRIRGTFISESVASDPEIDEVPKALTLELPIEIVAAYQLLSEMNKKTADNLYYQYQSGFLSDEAWNAFRAELKALLSQSGPPGSILRFDIEHYPDQFRESFHELLIQIIAEIDADSA